jgi:hypothetical protein
MTRFCKDCRFYQPGDFGDPERNVFYSKCLRPEAAATHIITGEQAQEYCHLARAPWGVCGGEGNLFEPKEGV